MEFGADSLSTSRSSAGLSLVIATPGLHGRRWLTTRPVWRQGELVAWCEGIDMGESDPETTEMTEIVLSEAHMIRLASTKTEVKMEEAPSRVEDEEIDNACETSSSFGSR